MLTRGGRGVKNPENLADVICEWPLMKHTACNERIEERGMHQSEVESGRASDRLLARLSDVWKERDVDERSINDFGLVLMSRKEEKEEEKRTH